MAFMNFLLGRGEKQKTRSIYSPQQESILDLIGGGLQQGLPEGMQNLLNILGGGPEAFGAFEAPALRQFEEQILPSIAERFTGMFGEGSQRSSAFGQQLGHAGAALAERLAAQRSGLQSGALKQLLQLLQPGMAPRQQQFTQTRQPGFLENVAVEAAPAVASALVGGAPGAIMGGIKGLAGLIGKYSGASSGAEAAMGAAGGIG